MSKLVRNSWRWEDKWEEDFGVTHMNGKLSFLLNKDANDMSSDFVMNLGLVIFANDVNIKGLRMEEQ